jgi:hypothetical protein
VYEKGYQIRTIMSGGTFDYLCYKSAGELLEADHELQSMADALAELGYAEDAARETQEILLTIRAMRNRVQVSIDRLTDVWRTMEWWRSGDYSEDQLEEALAKFRGEDTK